MRRTTGHMIRITGLVIEMLGVWLVYSGNGNKEQARIELPGGNAIPVAFVVVGIGFVLWLTGVLLIQAGRPRRRRVVEEDASERPVV